jgi:hypothetical protein
MDEYNEEDFEILEVSNKKRPGRPKNEIWQHFFSTPVTLTGGKKDLHAGAQCKYCLVKWSREKPSEMVAHIALNCSKPPPAEVHATYLEILNNGLFDDDDNGNTSKKLKTNKQSKITSHVEKLTITDDKQRRSSRALTKFFVCRGVPFWIVENPFFIDFVKTLCPGYQIPKRTTLSNNMINAETATVITEMKRNLSNETNLTLGIILFNLLIN